MIAGAQRFAVCGGESADSFEDFVGAERCLLLLAVVEASLLDSSAL
jgi:hypothetical protein